ncbi:glycosyltransferase involved in cell wall biosynthesis [Pontibacter ummariensis]|uniref:Glycosyltransferase involved in cell wall bisynthesis n=1 Tax=Pontibacter ummariensis TaxID=1610492 RepID=A0A239IHJ7_9BACT|nr:glycosyltransferase family 4 protein [Pontibacter ummariensis]PRY09852.1 glycosyltransferase involved in cell wall biosynthesis [Pontibacter ummariensis]SNS93035.1 Glycosyltransferase involved in cell wall bisynthesis [Pontibacter ummariensis]
MRIAIVINTSWNVYNFRMPLLKAFLAAGHEVVAIAPRDAYSDRLVAAGCGFVPVEMENGTNPLTDLLLIGRLYKTYKQVQPDVVLHYTIKPNIYGAIAAHWAGIPAVNNVSGLGTVFITKDYVSNVALRLYRFSFRYPAKVFFQNRDDRQLFLRHKLVRPEITEVLPGSGIDLQAFVPAQDFKRNKAFTFLMVARVQFDKGIAEFVQASRLVQERYPEVRCQLLGQVDERSRSAVKRRQLEEWLATGVIEYLGATDEVASVVGAADCIVLPSYREGTPRTLLEAAAMGKPLIATNVPGCREVVEDGVNGLLCRVRHVPDLAAKMMQLLELDDTALERMGQASRQIAVTRFDVRQVIQKYLQAIEEVTSQVRV